MKSKLSYLVNVISCSFLFCLLFVACSQNRPSPPKESSGQIGDVMVTINYSSPAVKERTVWGELVPYGQVWRTGANEATVIKFDKPVLVEGEALPAGEYAVFTIPQQEEWTVIFNKEIDQWGTDYDENGDVLRVKVKPETADKFNERLTFEVRNNGGDAGKVVLLWENLLVPVSVVPAE